MVCSTLFLGETVLKKEKIVQFKFDDRFLKANVLFLWNNMH